MGFTLKTLWVTEYEWYGLWYSFFCKQGTETQKAMGYNLLELWVKGASTVNGIHPMPHILFNSAHMIRDLAGLQTQHHSWTPILKHSIPFCGRTHQPSASFLLLLTVAPSRRSWLVHRNLLILIWLLLKSHRRSCVVVPEVWLLEVQLVLSFITLCPDTTIHSPLVDMASVMLTILRPRVFAPKCHLDYAPWYEKLG